MSVLARLLPDNPVLTKEMRVRMRGARAYWILFGYLGFLSLVLLFQYGAWLREAQATGGLSNAARLGESIFGWLTLAQMFLVLFITPAITAGAITIENEQRTMDMLTMTRLSRRSIVLGKLLAATLFTALLLISSLPLVSICFLLGSVDPGMVVSYYMMMLMGSLMVGAMGLMWSALAKTTTQAVLYTYATLGVVFAIVSIPFGFQAAPNISGSIIENLLRVVGAAWFGERFLGISGPAGIGFSLLCALTAWLCAAVAMSRLETYPERRAWLLRGITALIVGVQWIAFNLLWLDAWYRRGTPAILTAVQPPISVLILTVTLLFFLVPIFATGELTSAEARQFWRSLLRGWTPKELAQGKISSGPPFLLLLTLLGLLLYVLTFVVVGKPSDFARSGGGPVATTPPVGNWPQPAPGTVTTTRAWDGQTVVTRTELVNGKIITSETVNGKTAQTIVDGMLVGRPHNYRAGPAHVGDFPQAAVTILVSVLGLSLLSMALALLFRSRPAACLVVYMLLLVILIVPEMSKIPFYSGGEPGFGVNLFYANPMQPLFQMAEPATYWNRPLMETSRLLFGTMPMWQAVSLVWGGVGLLSLLLMVPLVRRELQRTESLRQ